MKILLINGVNLNFLGLRDASKYGRTTYEDLMGSLEKKAKELESDLECFQSNHEGAIVDKLQEAYLKGVDGIIINPGAFTHYSYAIRDALEIFTCKKIEVHISHIHKREAFRHTSVIAAVCDAQISGLGVKGYEFALEYLCENKV